MGEQLTWSAEEAARSYAHWWREAGLHTAIDDAPHGWRDGIAAPFWQRAAETPPPVPVEAPVQRVAETLAPPPRSTAMPATLPAFLDWLAQDATLPEATWDGAMILPPAIEQALLLIIVEMPTAGASDTATLLDPAQRKFLDAMLASIGLKPDDAAITPLAARRPPGGLLDEATLTSLAARMTHYLGLARPGAAILLGDRTSRALIGAQGQPAGQLLRSINHASGMVDAVALAGLDLLMNRPAAKARSWQSLRLLHGKLNG